MAKKKELPRGVRNNNPLNIKKTKPLTKWQGVEPIQSDTIFVTFKQMKWGIRAAARILIKYQDDYDLDTVRLLIHRWAPEDADNNPTGAYVAHVCDEMGITPGDRVNVHKYNTLFPLVKAMSQFENGGDFITDEQIKAGLALAGVEPEMKPLAKSKSIQGSTVVAGTGLSLGALDMVNEHADEGIPLLAKIMDYAPHFVIGAIVVGALYFIYKRWDERQKGIR